MENDLPLIQDENKTFYFRVIGVDRKIHVSDLHTDKCKCCVEILRKYVTEKDYNEFFSCYEYCECTY